MRLTYLSCTMYDFHDSTDILGISCNANMLNALDVYNNYNIAAIVLYGLRA